MKGYGGRTLGVRVTVRMTKNGIDYGGEYGPILTHPDSPFPKFIAELPIRISWTEEAMEENRIQRALSTLRSAEYERRDGPSGVGLYLIEK